MWEQLLRRITRALMLSLVALIAVSAHAQPRLTNNTVVTADQVAADIANSPRANAWLRANAGQIGSLSMFESGGGNLSIYNGSCCYGILQMTGTNIRAYANVEPEVFRNWPLQRQIDVWSRMQSEALNDPNVRRLMALSTFDGQPVDAAMVLACIQLGQGNCGRMLRSGRCSGFADPNGVTICRMAEEIRRRMNGNGPAPNPNPNPGTPNPGADPGVNPGPGWGVSRPNFDCVRGADGGCMSMSEAMRAGFQSGSGVTMDRLRSFNQLLLVALTLLIVGSALVGVWRQYANGAISKADLLLYSKRGFLVVGMIFVVMSLF